MFLEFFYYLRAQGLQVSPDEWIMLLQALEKGCGRATFTGFYQLCRTVLVKDEKFYDRFDQAFLSFFKDLETPEGTVEEKFLKWLEEAEREVGGSDARKNLKRRESSREIQEKFLEQLHTQEKAYNGGALHVGTGGVSFFGNDGYSPRGIRVDGTSHHHRAFQIASERHFKDFTQTTTLDNRQFQVALRRLRQYSVRNEAEPLEFDVDATVEETCQQGGRLQVEYRKPRKNTVKLLLLMDSGGSMDPYSELCSQLFHAVRKDSHWQNLKIFYFHNTIYAKVFTKADLKDDSTVPTEWLLNNLDSSWKVIIVGDATMEPSELLDSAYYSYRERDSRSSLEWYRLIKAHFPHTIWLTPSGEPSNAFWAQTYLRIAKEFPMYRLSVEGLQQGFRYLMTGK